ncbi:MAG: hypothetical protein IJS13_06420 [Paludibacteraceae bacterium]|nr:hypothetical protein [Paludibacteraceae bacterium]
MKFSFDNIRSLFQEILSGDVFTRETFRKQYGLILFVVFLFGVYINAGYQAQRQQRRIAELNKQIEEAHFEYLTVSAQLVEQTRQSVISKRLEENGSKVSISQETAVLVE